MRKPKVQMEIVPNGDCRLYHTNFKMTENRIGQTLECGMLSNEEKDLKNSSETTKRLAIGVMGIEGLKTFNLHPHELQFVKAPLFDWDEIEPQIISLIQMVGQEALGEPVEHVLTPINNLRKWGMSCPDSLIDEVLGRD